MLSEESRQIVEEVVAENRHYGKSSQDSWLGYSEYVIGLGFVLAILFVLFAFIAPL